jgi:hypothetical protein
MKKQVFKSVRLTRVKAVRNILKIWELTHESDRYDWYNEAQIFARTFAGNELDVNKFCGLLACFSPLKSWDQNKKLAAEFYLTGDCGHMKAFKLKGTAIMASDGDEKHILSILKGAKISAFYLNIRYPDKAISLTIDRHALSVALGYSIKDTEYAMTAGQYKFFSECYRHAAAKVGVNPLVMQSATWLMWRRLKKKSFQLELI